MIDMFDANHTASLCENVCVVEFQSSAGLVAVHSTANALVTDQPKVKSNSSTKIEQKYNKKKQHDLPKPLWLKGIKLSSMRQQRCVYEQGMRKRIS